MTGATSRKGSALTPNPGVETRRTATKPAAASVRVKPILTQTIGMPIASAQSGRSRRVISNSANASTPPATRATVRLRQTDNCQP